MLSLFIVTKMGVCHYYLSRDYYVGSKSTYSYARQCCQIARQCCQMMSESKGHFGPEPRLHILLSSSGALARCTGNGRVMIRAR